MGDLLWDSLLETCLRRGATDVLLVPGAAPLVRLSEGWRELQVRPITLEGLQALANQQIGDNPPQRDGYVCVDFKYGEEAFRALAFGFPATTSLLVSRNNGEAAA